MSEKTSDTTCISNFIQQGLQGGSLNYIFLNNIKIAHFTLDTAIHQWKELMTAELFCFPLFPAATSDPRKIGSYGCWETTWSNGHIYQGAALKKGLKLPFLCILLVNCNNGRGSGKSVHPIRTAHPQHMRHLVPMAFSLGNQVSWGQEGLLGGGERREDVWCFLEQITGFKPVIITWSCLYSDHHYGFELWVRHNCV